MAENDKQEDAIVTSDYRLAPSGEGPLAYTWDDKPHRLVYDLCGEVDTLRAEILSLSQERDRLREALSVAFDNFDELVNWHYGGEWPVEDEKLAALERARAALNKEPPCQET